MQRRVCSQPRPGFTTVEALIAAVVFLLGLSGLMGALTQARNSTGQARRYMQAMDIANDLIEQMQLWGLDDPRLKAMSGVCVDDPLDKNEALLKPDSADYNAFVTCMRSDVDLKNTLDPKNASAKMPWGGLQEETFTDEQGVITKYKRYYIVRTQTVRPGVSRWQMWVKVVYSDVGEPRVVSTQAMRIQMGL